MGTRRQKGEVKKLRQIAFDLDTANLKQYYPKPQGSTNENHYTHAYDDIEAFLKKNDFSHRQGSVYVSKKKISRAEAHSVIEQMAVKMPWLYKCVNKMDLTIVNEVEQDLIGVITDATLDYLQSREVLDIDAEPENTDINGKQQEFDQYTSLQSQIKIAEERKTDYAKGIEPKDMYPYAERY